MKLENLWRANPMTSSQLPLPKDQMYYEDYLPGAVYTFGSIPVIESEVLEFANTFDPQPMHVDLDWAASGPFAGLIGSGWHTAGLMMRLYADHFLSFKASIVSPGIDELRWLKPVRPGDNLSIRVTVLEAKPSQSKPDRGMIRTFVEVLSQDGTVLMTLKPMNLMRRRPV
jgi:acyl dehydratase